MTTTKSFTKFFMGSFLNEILSHVFSCSNLSGRFDNGSNGEVHRLTSWLK